VQPESEKRQVPVPVGVKVRSKVPVRGPVNLKAAAAVVPVAVARI
jgi:hypothetical protein